MHQNTISWY